MENQKKESPEPSTERDSECDCDEQREAKAALEEMKKGLRFLREQQAAGQAPSPSDPEEATIENGFEGEMEWLESESRRPSSRRLSVSADPPREVLKALVRTTVLDPQDLQVEEDYTLNLSILRFVKERDGSMGVGFSLSKRKAWTPPTEPDVQVAVMEWQDSFGAWPVVNWAWLIALVLRKLPEEFREIANITPSYKLQHSPQQDFRLRMREAFVDVCRTNRLRDFSAPFLSAIFMFHPSHPQFDLDRRQDCALFFDTRLWRVARDLGFQVQDRTQRPAFTYFIGKSDLSVVDSTRRRWKDIDAYIRGRLSSSPPPETLSEEERERHIEYIIALLRAYQLDPSLQEGMGGSNVDVFVAYKEFREKKLSKDLRKVASKYERPVPSFLAQESDRRCSQCGKGEGEIVEEGSGKVGVKLSHCPCHSGPRYCGVACQKAHWKAGHKSVCPARRNAQGSRTSVPSSKR